ncbi:hypothetical protein ACFWFI_11440 [Streptomyces sp. NPDC060209]|uniref:hypothetical protein n=1 Tax=Streptomyces sp. NPDC060209 TaxID=3347073 RepID=UPI00366622AC
MTSPDEPEQRFTLPAAVARYDALRTREALAAPPGEDEGREHPPLTRSETLGLLAPGEVISRRAAYGRQLSVRSARRTGASWARIGEAPGTGKRAAWEAHTRRIGTQPASEHRGIGQWGLEEGEIATARALADEVEDGR